MPESTTPDLLPSSNFSNWLSKFRLTIVLALTGALLIGIGIQVFFWPRDEDTIEIITISPTPALGTIGEIPNQIWVDVGGAVGKPGVYQLSSGSRVNDLLVLAGGITASANRDWIDQNLNRAQTLSDGIKIYIPFKSETPPTVAPITSTQTILSANTSPINLNTATQKELESLWGIGPVTAEKIIATRPFSRPEEILEKKLVKSNVWNRIKSQITVY